MSMTGTCDWNSARGVADIITANCIRMIGFAAAVATIDENDVSLASLDDDAADVVAVTEALLLAPPPLPTPLSLPVAAEPLRDVGNTAAKKMPQAIMTAAPKAKCARDETSAPTR